MKRSPILFKFDFCVELNSLVAPIDCQTADIYANVLESAINQGLGEASDAYITRVGDASLTKVDGSTVCGGSLEGQDFINDQTGTTPDLSNPPTTSTSICGVITTEEYECSMDDCLAEIYESIINNLNAYIDDGSLTATIQGISTTRLPSVPELKIATAESGSLSTFNLLLPATMSAQIGESKYAKDGQECVAKTAFATWEIKYNSLYECCAANFGWNLDTCCSDAGGCDAPATASTTTTSTTSGIASSATTTTTPSVKYYATWQSGKLCNVKNTFESWEQTFGSLKECCTKQFAYVYNDCCNSAGMGGCV